jgi:DNA-binding NtrC family response regulator
MVGTSDPIRRIFALIRQVAPSDVPVLLTGESGTGKELAALAIHERSPRARSPFVAINCAAIPEALLESELFGYERGAFTGATQARRGRFEAAQGGTIFLDEVGDLAPSLQVKLLRFLQDHVVERVGARSGLPLDVRVIAATNRDISAMVQQGQFREDLYFRLAVFTVDIPPLRERGEDVVLMARYFLQRYAKDSVRPIRGFTPEAVDAMLDHPWPGNVRELINRVRRAVVVAEGSLICPTDLGLKAISGDPALVTLREARREAEERCVRSALRRANWNKVEAARALGISRTQLYELMARHKIPHDERE